MKLLRLLPVVLLGLQLGCTPCNSVGCDFGFDLEVVAPGGLLEGSYDLDLEIEGKGYLVQCEVGGVTGPGACSVEESGGAFDVETAVIDGGDGQMITVDIVDTSESEGSFLIYRGPESVAIELRREGQLLGEAGYMPSYERIEHRGAPTCGYCDEPIKVERLEIGATP